MEPLQYTSKEMFSSTELIRKNKMIFDKLTKQEIDKAVILRDGKPSFMLLEFAQYEQLMTEYLKLKEKNKSRDSFKGTGIAKPITIDDIKIEESKIEVEEIDKNELASALEEIDNLNLDDLDVKDDKTKQDEEELKVPLKDFWE